MSTCVWFCCLNYIIDDVIFICTQLSFTCEKVRIIIGYLCHKVQKLVHIHYNDISIAILYVNSQFQIEWNELVTTWPKTQSGCIRQVDRNTNVFKNLKSGLFSEVVT